MRDATGTLVMPELETMELPRVNPELSTQYADSDGNGRSTLQAPSSKPFTRRFEMFTIHRYTGVRVISALLGVTLMVTPVLPVPIPRTTITLSGTPWGMSPCDIGATEGNARFDMADLQAAGITTYRLCVGCRIGSGTMMTASMARRRSQTSRRTPRLRATRVPSVAAGGEARPNAAAAVGRSRGECSRPEHGVWR
jgi:hypothetical protein